MSEYLVRWKFGPNSLLNHTDTDTYWYQQIHPSKKKAVDHYTTLLLYSVPAMAMSAEIFQLVQLIPGQSVTDDVTEEQVTANKELNGVVPNAASAYMEKRNKRILKMFAQGKTRKEIADATDVNYQTVCTIIRNDVTAGA